MHVPMAFRLQRILGIAKAAADAARLELLFSLADQRRCEERIHFQKKKAQETSSDLDGIFRTRKSSSGDWLNLHAIQRKRLDSILTVLGGLSGEHENSIKRSGAALSRYQEEKRRESAILQLNEQYKNKLLRAMEKKEEEAADDNCNHGKKCF